MRPRGSSILHLHAIQLQLHFQLFNIQLVCGAVALAKTERKINRALMEIAKEPRESRYCSMRGRISYVFFFFYFVDSPPLFVSLPFLSFIHFYLIKILKQI